MARFWGPNIQIDGSWYRSKDAIGKPQPAFGKIPPPAPPSARDRFNGVSSQDRDCTPRGRMGSTVAGAPHFSQFSDGKYRPGMLQDASDIYEYDTQEVFRGMEGNLVAQIILAGINRTSRQCRVVPRDMIESLTGNPAVAKPVNGCASAACKAFDSDSEVNYQPYTMTLIDTLYGHDPFNIVDPDNVLLHELLHALRQMRGKVRGGKAPLGFPNIEELLAVLVENMYLSKAGRNNALVPSYASVPFSGPWQAYEDFYARTYPVEIQIFFDDLPDVAGHLARITGSWNPLRKFLENRAASKAVK